MAEHATLIEVGYQVFTGEGQSAVGAVRQVGRGPRNELVIDIEGAGDFTINREAVSAVHDEKVILNVNKLPTRLRDAIAHAHDQEDPNL